MIAKHDFIISCPETTVSRLAIILKKAAGAMALVSAQGVAYAGEIVITINRISLNIFNFAVIPPHLLSPLQLGEMALAASL